jgi:hypothetical protein
VGRVDANGKGLNQRAFLIAQLIWYSDDSIFGSKDVFGEGSICVNAYQLEIAAHVGQSHFADIARSTR